MIAYFDKDMYLVYSPDDDGYYWQDDKDRTSQIFKTEQAAMLAREQGGLTWRI